MKIIETERLILREWRLEDLDDFHECAENPNVGPMVGWKPHSSKEESLCVLNSYIADNGRWAIILKENRKAIGSIRIYPDENRASFSERNSAKLMSYFLSFDYWNNGYMTETVNRAIKYAFDDLNIELLTVFHTPQNVRTRRVIEKCGFQYETTIEQGYKNFDGQTFDSVCYSIIKSDYRKNKCK